MRRLSIILKISAVLWVVWGIVHIMAGIFLFPALFQGDTATAVHTITDKVNLATLQIEYPYSVTAILKQHAWNLLWAGIVTLIGGLFIWRRSKNAIFLCAIVGGLMDLGYFMFIDLAGLAKPPGPQVTWVCAAAIITSFYVYFKSDKLKSL